MQRIAIFASGSGSNAQEIMAHFEKSEVAKVGLVVCNNPKAGVFQKAATFDVPTALIDRASFYASDDFLKVLRDHQIDFIVLAGFLWLVPDYLIAAYPNKIINIHPALLPKFGGKGMYGHHVHKAVVAAQELESGITIHYVNGEYDKGQIIFQAACPIAPSDDPETVAKKVLQLEHRHFSIELEKLLQKI